FFITCTNHQILNSNKPLMSINTFVLINTPFDEKIGWIITENVYTLLRKDDSPTYIIKPLSVKDFITKNPQISYKKLASTFEAQGYIILKIKEINIPEIEDMYINSRLSSSSVISRESFIRINLAMYDLSESIIWSDDIIFKDLEHQFYYDELNSPLQSLFRTYEEEVQILINGVSENIVNSLPQHQLK
ncbi:MAG: hypothetical protein AB1765_09870, partial [Candidatus Hydrogenedentota bacterium]